MKGARTPPQEHPRGPHDRQKRWRERNPWARYVEYARRRCQDPEHKSWASHGARGIRVRLTAREAGVLWERDRAASMRRPSLDRKDATKDYIFDNCRFIEHFVNGRLPHEDVPDWVISGERDDGLEYVMGMGE